MFLHGRSGAMADSVEVGPVLQEGVKLPVERSVFYSGLGEGGHADQEDRNDEAGKEKGPA